MARMIPPVVHDGTRSDGEVTVFGRIRDDPNTRSWIVLHSYDLPAHATRFMGEIDFVVIVPGHGILCLSVKDCATASRDSDGVWKLGRLAPSASGPFKAARDDMFSLRSRILAALPQLSAVAFGFAVLFTRVIATQDFRKAPTEWEPHEQIYSDEFNSRPISQLFVNSIDLSVRKLQATTQMRIIPHDFSDEQAASILGLMRPELEMYQTPKDRARQTAAELKRYTDEQFDALDVAECNMRVMYQGLAGTGKTLLALEAARRAANRGERVLLLCFNTLLRDWMRAQFEDMSTVTVDNVHGLLFALTDTAYVDEPNPSFWPALVNSALDRLVNEADDAHQYDTLIVDEAQDVYRGEYIDVLDLLLIGGIKNGRWLMFTDYEQNIFGESRTFERSMFDPVDFCAAAGSPAYRHPLRRNCRNTPRVGQWAELLGRVKPGYAGFRRPDDGLPPTLLFYRSERDEKDMLIGTLTTLRDEHFSPAEIVILSAVSVKKCCASQIIQEPWKSRLKPYNQDYQAIRYCSIHRFKGLEAPCIVITDVDKLGDAEHASLLYVALTRATNRVVILALEAVRDEIKSLLIGGK